MNLLATLLPGFRDLRIPMSAGLLWLIVLVVVFASDVDALILDTPQTAAIGRLLRLFPESSIVVVAVAVAFVLGITVTAPSLSLMRVLGRLVQRILRKLDQAYNSRYLERLMGRSSSYREYSRFALYLRRCEEGTRPVSAAAHSMIMDTILSTFGRAKVPGSVAMLYPIDFVIDSLPYLAPHLSVTAPTLYQDYDRFRAEAELRMAIVPPLLVLAFGAPIAAKPLIVALVAIGCIALLIQAVQQTRSASNVLANAAYLNHVSLPSLQVIIDALGDLRDAPQSKGEWTGAMICAMDQRSLYQEAHSFIDQMLDFDDSKRIVSTLEYLKHHNFSQFTIAVNKLRGTNSEGHLQALRDLKAC